MEEKEPFTKVMRKATRGIHNISDALINAKLGIAVSDNAVWAGGLAVFYEVFQQLEGALDRLKGTLIEQLDIPGMRRTKAFEKDLEFYLGASWKSKLVRDPSVEAYIAYLRDLEEKSPTLLLAYIYHLYMGLFAGGQILKKKRSVVMRVFSTGDVTEGLAVVDVEGSIYEIKKRMRTAMDAIAEGLDDETKEQLICESKNVFTMNNTMVRSIRGTNQVLVAKLMKVATLVVLIAVAVYYYRRAGLQD